METGEKDSDDTALDHAVPKRDGLDEPPVRHERKPDERQPTNELRWTQAVIRGGRRPKRS